MGSDAGIKPFPAWTPMIYGPPAPVSPGAIPRTSTYSAVIDPYTSWMTGTNTQQTPTVEQTTPEEAQTTPTGGGGGGGDSDWWSLNSPNMADYANTPLAWDAWKPYAYRWNYSPGEGWVVGPADAQGEPGWSVDAPPTNYRSWNNEEERPWLEPQWSSSYSPFYYAPGTRWFDDNYYSTWDSATQNYRYQPRNQNTFMNPWKHPRRWTPRPLFGKGGEPIDGRTVGGVKVMGGKNNPAAQAWAARKPEPPNEFPNHAVYEGDWYGGMAEWTI